MHQLHNRQWLGLSSPQFKESCSARAFVRWLTVSKSSLSIIAPLLSGDGEGAAQASSFIGSTRRDRLAIGKDDELVSVNEALSMKTLSISRVRLMRSVDMMTSSIITGFGGNRAYLLISKSSSLTWVSLFMIPWIRRRDGSRIVCTSTLKVYRSSEISVEGPGDWRTRSRFWDLNKKHFISHITNYINKLTRLISTLELL